MRMPFVTLAWLVAMAWAGSAPAQAAGAEAPAPPAAVPVIEEPPAATNAPYKIPQNRVLEFTLPLSRSARQAVLSSKNPLVEYARAAIAVPSGFETDLPAPILLVCGTSDGDGSSIRPMRVFADTALRLGWVVIAAEGPLGKPPQDNPPWRWAMISSLLDHIHKTWPGSRRWPIAVAGVSGGAKWAGVTGAILAQKNYNLIGVFMGAVNEDFASEAAKIYDPAVRYKQAPIYLSSGSDDQLATPAHHEEVRVSLLHNGFSRVRLETFKGGHAFSDAELRKALSWFIEVYGKGGSDDP